VLDTRSSLPQMSYKGGTLEISLPVTSQFLIISCLQRILVLSGRATRRGLLTSTGIMIQLQPSPHLRHETGRMLPCLYHSQQDRHRLEGLADAAVCLQEPGIYSPASSPSSPHLQEYNFGMDD
jgi:hypothetical protein